MTVRFRFEAVVRDHEYHPDIKYLIVNVRTESKQYTKRDVVSIKELMIESFYDRTIRSFLDEIKEEYVRANETGISQSSGKQRP